MISGARSRLTIRHGVNSSGLSALPASERGGAVVSSGAFWFLAGRSCRRVQCRRLAYERLQRLLIDLVALVKVDGAPGVAFEAGVEEVGRVVQRGAPGKGHLHDGLVGLAGADDAVVLPHRNAPPLPLLDHVGDGLLDDASDTRERLAAPIAELLDSCIDVPSGRASAFCFVRAALLHACRFLHGCRRSAHNRSPGNWLACFTQSMSWTSSSSASSR